MNDTLDRVGGLFDLTLRHNSPGTRASFTSGVNPAVSVVPGYRGFIEKKVFINREGLNDYKTTCTVVYREDQIRAIIGDEFQIGSDTWKTIAVLSSDQDDTVVIYEVT